MKHIIFMNRSLSRILVAIVTLVSFFALTPTVRADDVTISVTGNGSSSQNQATVNAPTTTTVTQSNSSTINNQTDTKANTGNNQTSANSGNASVSTGNVA